MPPPLASNPHRFHEDRSEIAHDIARLASMIAPRRVRRSVAGGVGTPHFGEDDFERIDGGKLRRDLGRCRSGPSPTRGTPHFGEDDFEGIDGGKLRRRQ
jgi:hypothetical protein